MNKKILPVIKVKIFYSLLLLNSLTFPQNSVLECIQIHYIISQPAPLSCCIFESMQVSCVLLNQLHLQLVTVVINQPYTYMYKVDFVHLLICRY